MEPREGPVVAQALKGFMFSLAQAIWKFSFRVHKGSRLAAKCPLNKDKDISQRVDG